LFCLDHLRLTVRGVEEARRLYEAVFFRDPNGFKLDVVHADTS
jgi:hypothetical protein